MLPSVLTTIREKVQMLAWNACDMIPVYIDKREVRVDIGQALFWVFKDRDYVEVDNQKENFSCGTNAGNPERARSEHRNSAITINLGH